MLPVSSDSETVGATFPRCDLCDRPTVPGRLASKVLTKRQLPYSDSYTRHAQTETARALGLRRRVVPDQCPETRNAQFADAPLPGAGQTDDNLTRAVSAL